MPIDNLERHLRDVGKQHQPDRDWQRKVWRRIERRRRIGQALFVTAFLLACIVGAVILGVIGGLLSLRWL